MKIEHVTWIWMFVHAMIFEPQKWQKVKFWTFQSQPASGLFHPYFLCKSSFRVISMIKMVIWDESKPLSLYLKIKKSKIQKSEIRILHVYYS